MAKKKSTTNYVDNAKLFQEMIKYKQEMADHTKDPTKPKAVIPTYVAESIIKIAERFASRPNFAGYTYRDEMISDGIENCITGIHNYDETKSNPFAYFSQIIFYAFLRRITKEKKQSFIKMKLMETLDYKGEVIKKYLNPEEDKTYANPYAEIFKLSDNDLKFFDEHKQKTPKKSNKDKAKSNKGLDEFSQE